MRFLTLITTGLVSFAVGVLGALGFASLTSTTQTELETRVAKVEKRADARTSALQVQAEEQLASLHKDLTTAHADKEWIQKKGEHFAQLWLKANALIHMIQTNDGIYEIVRSEKFRLRFKGDWYDPELSFKMIGGRWFAKEMHECDLLSDDEYRIVTTPKGELDSLPEN
jgi:hypothetical protein